jgi:hypothetical protein
MVLYKVSVFYADRKFKMAATAGNRLTLDPMKFKMAATAVLSLTLDPMGKMVQNASLKPLDN